MISSRPTVDMEECAYNLKCATELARLFHHGLRTGAENEVDLQNAALGVVQLLEHITAEAERAALAERTHKRRV